MVNINVREIVKVLTKSKIKKKFIENDSLLFISVIFFLECFENSV